MKRELGGSDSADGGSLALVCIRRYMGPTSDIRGAHVLIGPGKQVGADSSPTRKASFKAASAARFDDPSAIQAGWQAASADGSDQNGAPATPTGHVAAKVSNCRPKKTKLIKT